jgi:hypothetical protein
MELRNFTIDVANTPLNIRKRLVHLLKLRQESIYDLSSIAIDEEYSFPYFKYLRENHIWVGSNAGSSSVITIRQAISMLGGTIQTQRRHYVRP